MSFQPERCDGIHHALAQSLVKVLARRFQVLLGEIDRFAYHDGDASRPRPFFMDRPRLVRAENSYRHHRRERFRDDQAQPRLRRLQFPVWRALALGKHQRPLARPENSDQRLERRAIFSTLGIDRDDVQLWQEPSEKRPIEKGPARKKINSATGSAAGKRRIEKALVIGCENDWPVIDHPFAMQPAQPEKNPADQFDEIATKPVVRIQKR